MNYKIVIKIVASILIVLGFAMLSSAIVSYLMGDDRRTIELLALSSVITIFFGTLLRLIFIKDSTKFGIREGFAVVSFGWILAAIFGALPFILIGDFKWYDAIFESMSGFTTTGASVIDEKLLLNSGKHLISGLKGLPYGLIYWRSLTHWLGGMGIVVLSLAILPSLGISPQQLYNAEVPGPIKDKFTPRIATSAKILWVVYILLSLIQTILLYIGGMDLFESICTTFGTMATGGFSTEGASIGAFNSIYIDIVTTIFMMLAGTNFILHFKFIKGESFNYFKDEEFRFYFLTFAISSIIIALFLTGKDIITTSGIVYKHSDFLTALRFSSFQVASILTTTGFATAKFNLWPASCGLLLIFLMFFGGCAGSTGGGIKHSRIISIIKYAINQIKRGIFPRVLTNVRLNGERLENYIVHKTMAFFFIFIAIFVIFTFLLTITGVDDIVTAMTASIACLGNIGPGLGKVGPDCTYSWLSPMAKILLSFEMLLGRLELYTVLVIFLPSFWKK